MIHIDLAVPVLIPEMPSAEEVLPWLKKIDEKRWYTNYGPLNSVLDARLSEYLSTQSSAGIEVETVSSGTAALQLSMMIKLKPGSRVLVPSYTFVASGLSILHAGCTPVLADCDQESWLLTPEIAEQVLDDYQFDAVMPVAVFGYPCDIKAWQAFSKKHGKEVIIDAAGAFGNQLCGEGITTCFSLHATKLLGAGEGGFIATSDQSFLETLREYSMFGIRDNVLRGQVVGVNSKLSEYHAAVGLTHLEQWPDKKARFEQLWHDYHEVIAALPGISSPHREKAIKTPLFNVKSDVSNTEFQAALAEHQIHTKAWYMPPLHKLEVFQSCDRTDMPVTEHRMQHVTGIPFRANAKDQVLQALKEVVG